MGCCESMLSSTYPQRKESHKRRTIEHSWMHYGGIEVDSSSPNNQKGMYYGGRYKADLYAYKSNKGANRYNTTSADESKDSGYQEDVTGQVTEDRDTIETRKVAAEV